MSLDMRTLLKIWLNLGLNLTTFQGTRPRRTLYSTMSEILPPHQFSSGPKGPGPEVHYTQPRVKFFLLTNFPPVQRDHRVELECKQIRCSPGECDVKVKRPSDA